ncbi:MAG: hypothetical protein P8Y23_04250 [Candidatus Lokiarchaeota archaeon]|jgi:hypothetical protein
MLIQKRKKLHRNQDLESELHSIRKNNSNHSLFKISPYSYGSDAKKWLYFSQLKED